MKSSNQKRATSSVLGTGIIELLAVLCLSGIILCWASNSIPKMLKAGALNRALSRLESLLDHAAQQALISREDVFCRFNLNDHSAGCYLNHNARPLSAVLSLKDVEFKSSKFSSSKLPANTLIFRASGTATPGRIVLSDGKRVCQIVQSLRGARRTECK